MGRFLNYRHKILAKRAAAPLRCLLPRRDPAALPPVTVFISSLNTRDALELTLKSLAATTRYPRCRLWIGDNGSTDGSVEFLDDLARQIPMRLDKRPEARRHYLWLDEVHASVDTPYWFAVDSDMLFLARDPLLDMVAVMERNPDVYLVAAEKREPEFGHPAPVTGEPLDLGEAPSTWLMCVRTSLRDRLSVSFQDGVQSVNPETGRKFCYDTGGKLAHAMREAGLRYHYMPKWFQTTYQHFGGLSWSTKLEVIPDEEYQKAKQRQLAHIRALAAADRRPIRFGY